jgi:hypothetical protein
MRQEIETFSLSGFTMKTVDDVDIDLQIKFLAPVRRSLYPSSPDERYGHIARLALPAPEVASDNPLDYPVLFICVACMLKSGDSLTMI